MKKVLLLIDSLGSGGAQRQMVGLSTLLNEQGYNTKLVYYHHLDFYKEHLDKAGVNSECIPGATNIFVRTFSIAKTVRTFKPDVVISYLDTPNIIACFLKLLGFKYKLIVSERNTTQIFSIREKIKFFLMRCADVIVPNSHSQENIIKNNYPKLFNKVHTITNFIDTDHFVPKGNLKSESCKMISVGRVTEQKNTLRFLQAIKKIRDEGGVFHVDWYGQPMHPYYSECEKYVAEHDLSSVFSFHKPVTNIENMYCANDVFVLPSIYEGYPNVMCEAMSCGKPIICARVCDNPYIVEEGGNAFLFDPYDVDDIAEKLKAYMRLGDEQRQTMARRSRDLALTNFSSKVFIDKYVDIIEN